MSEVQVVFPEENVTNISQHNTTITNEDGPQEPSVEEKGSESKENVMEQVLAITPSKDITVPHKPVIKSKKPSPKPTQHPVPTAANIKSAPGKRNITTPLPKPTKKVHVEEADSKAPVKLNDSHTKPASKPSTLTKSNKFAKECMMCRNKIEKDQKKRLLACAHRFHEVPATINFRIVFQNLTR